MKKKTTLFISLLIIIGIAVYSLVDFNEYEFSEYDIELVDYFNEVALNAEYDVSPNRITKWTKPMKLFIIKEKELSYEVSLIKNTIEKINNLVKDEFYIQLIDDPKKCNAIIFLMEKERLEPLMPDLFENIEYDINGLADIGFDLETFHILDARIFIDILQPKESIETTILEEITQSIGLMNDSEKYPDSVFYENKLDSIITVDYSKMDIEIIKMLYHPKMKPGLNYDKAEKVIKKILKGKKTFYNTVYN
ncbi:DUF2927 domain-containing protein [Winogradskyella sp. A2]|uniref:DUF2927 domain-containing protein n=1 Tax=Winogradskyella sp. A2 TaxID=3366944 RepID=UPI00398C594D